MLPDDPELTHAWPSIRAQLRRVLGDTAFEAWLARVEVESWDGDLLLLRAPAAIQEWVAIRFSRVVERAARQVLGPSARIAFHRESGRAQPPTEARPEASLNPRYSFDQFIIGRGNHLAHAAALAVAEAPGQAYNPLFVHAPPGLGKTHLLHAIGNYVLAFGGGAVVRYTTAETFTNHFLNALTTKAIEPFKRAYRDADVLLIDDVQFLASKARTEEEFFHTFNALYETGRQLVLTCDRMPRMLTALAERLRERFEAGLVASIAPPDLGTRVAILRKRAHIDRIPIEDPAVLDLVAARVTANVRTLEGALIRIVAHHSLTRRPLDLALAAEVLDVLHPQAEDDPPAGTDPSRAPLTISRIQATVAGHYGVSIEELVSGNRTAKVAWPRQVAIHLARDLTGASWPELGRAFGGRSHSTAVHACRRVAQRLAEDPSARQEIDSLARLLST